MMKTIFHRILTTTALCLAVAYASPAKADGAIYPGNLDKSSYLANDKERYQGHVIEACRLYIEAIEEARNTKSRLSEQEHVEKTEAARRCLIERIELYPDEINDTYWTQDGLYASPLYAALVGNDSSLVHYILQKGALPFLPDYCYTENQLSPEVQVLLFHARNRYNILEICLQAQRAGIKIEGEKPSRR